MASLAGAVGSLRPGAFGQQRPYDSFERITSTNQPVTDTYRAVMGMAASASLVGPVTVVDTYVAIMGLTATAGPESTGRPNDGVFGTRTPYATPGRRYGTFDKTTPVFPRPDDGVFGSRNPYGIAGYRYGDFVKAPADTDARLVVDTYIAVMTLTPFDEAVGEVTDTYRALMGMSAIVFAQDPARLVTDTYRPVATFAVASVVKSGTVPKFAADTYTPVMTMHPVLQYVSALTDTYAPLMTMSAVVSAGATVEVFDTYAPLMDMDYSLQTAQAVVDWQRADVYIAIMDMRAKVADAGEVDNIRISSKPYGTIRIVEI